MTTRGTVQRIPLLVVLTLILGTAASRTARAESEGDDEAYAVTNLNPADRKPEWFYLDADFGIQSISLNTFKTDDQLLNASIIPSSGIGPTASIGLGARFVFFTLGLRGRVGAYHDSAIERNVGNWQVWNLDGEAGFHFPMGKFEPRLVLGAGYTTFGGFSDAIRGLKAGINVNGLDARVGLGLDYYLTPTFSIGAMANAMMIALSRRGTSIRDLAAPKEVSTLNEARARILQGNGSSLGSSFNLTLGAGLHF